MSQTYKKLKDYFLHFGWIIALVFGVIVICTFFSLTLKYIHIILGLIVLLIMIFWPMKFIYTLVGGRNSISTFFILFILVQFFFSFVYFQSLKNYYIVADSDSYKVEYFTPKISDCQLKYIGATSFEYFDILSDTFTTSISQSGAPLFNKIIEYSTSKSLAKKISTLINIQVFISWLYLGVLISSLYQKLKNE